jgi:hypothetical protein
MTAVHVDSPTERPDLLGGIATSKSGLGTPDFFYFAGAADTPSWLKTRPQSANRPDVSHPPSTTTNSAATRLAAQAGDDPLKIAKDSESPANQLVPGENDESKLFSIFSHARTALIHFYGQSREVEPSPIRPSDKLLHG